MNKTLILQLFVKWTLLVWVNSAYSIFIAVHKFHQPADIAGIICGVFSFVVIYIVADYQLWMRNEQELRLSLIYSVLFKSLFQILPAIEFMAGVFAIEIVSVFFNDIPFVFPYCVTLVDGIFLSILMLVCMLMIHIIRLGTKQRYAKYEEQKDELGM